MTRCNRWRWNGGGKIQIWKSWISKDNMLRVINHTICLMLLKYLLGWICALLWCTFQIALSQSMSSKLLTFIYFLFYFTITLANNILFTDPLQGQGLVYCILLQSLVGVHKRRDCYCQKNKWKTSMPILKCVGVLSLVLFIYLNIYIKTAKQYPQVCPKIL